MISGLLYTVTLDHSLLPISRFCWLRLENVGSRNSNTIFVNAFSHSFEVVSLQGFVGDWLFGCLEQKRRSLKESKT